VHAAAALWHHYVKKDDVLTRMLPVSGRLDTATEPNRQLARNT
jgi:hypothetical protein